MSNQRWFGREPALVLQAVAAFLTLLVGFSLPHLDDKLAAAIMAFLTAGAAVWTAGYVRPVAPTVFGGLIAAGSALVSTIWLHASQAHTGALAALAAVLVALLTRPQQDYLDPVGVVPIRR